MADENLFNGSAAAGSPNIGSAPNPNVFGAGQAQGSQAAGTVIDPEQHKELESLVGRQGAELGELRKFFTDIAPLLDKLDKSPEIVQAIVDGNITPELAKAAMEGKITIADAQIVSKAQEEVKKDLGKDIKNTSAEDITKLIEEKANQIKTDFDAKLKERDEMDAFEANVNAFIARTPDFPEYAAAVDKWLDTHDVTDIAVAYYAVKGEISEKAAIKQAEAEKAELEKSGAINMGGGTSHPSRISGDNQNVIDALIASKSNPNIF